VRQLRRLAAGTQGDAGFECLVWTPVVYVGVTRHAATSRHALTHARASRASDTHIQDGDSSASSCP